VGHVSFSAEGRERVEVYERESSEKTEVRRRVLVLTRKARGAEKKARPVLRSESPSLKRTNSGGRKERTKTGVIDCYHNLKDRHSTKTRAVLPRT